MSKEEHKLEEEAFCILAKVLEEDFLSSPIIFAF